MLGFRRTAEADLEFIEAIESDDDTLRYLGETSVAWHRRQLEDPAIEHLVAEIASAADSAAGEVVGYAVLAKAFDNLEIRRLAIAPSARGTGRGRELVRALVARCYDLHHARRVWLDVLTANARARKLYESEGFFFERSAGALDILSHVGRWAVRWRDLHDERTMEAVRVLAEIPGVEGLILGGSGGRGEPWPMSDIDVIPIYAGEEVAERVERKRDELVDWWAASGRAQTLDLGRIAFTVGEVREALDGSKDVLDLLDDPRWFHGIDKAYGGRAATTDELTSAFVEWIARTRFMPEVVAARIELWRREAFRMYDKAKEGYANGGFLPYDKTKQRDAEPRNDSLPYDKNRQATTSMRESARNLRMVWLESWGERLGSMGREWTRFERMAEAHGHADVAETLAGIAGASTDRVMARVEQAPAFLRERIGLSLDARRLVGEDVTPERNARDQLAAFDVHVSRHRPDLAGEWQQSPDPLLGEHLERLGDLLAR